MRSMRPLVRAADLRTVKTAPKVADPFYATPEWKALRKACFERDGGRCVVCGAQAVVPDHIVSRRTWFAERRPGSPDTLANLRSLCRTHDNAVKEGPTGERRGTRRL